MRGYDYLERPVINESEPLMLTFGITLQQIIDVVSAQRPLHEHEPLVDELTSRCSDVYILRGELCKAEN